MQSGRQSADFAPPRTGRAAVIPMVVALVAAAALAAAAAAPSIQEAHATPPCSVFDAEKVWRAYDDIYTGEVVSVDGPRGLAAGMDGRGWAGGAEGETARVHFELARTLKGDPQPVKWHVDMPALTRCPGNFCAEGADRHPPGTEIFYLGGFNGMYSPASGACGVGSAEAGTRIGVPGMLFSYYKSLYGFSPPRDDPCRDPSHTLVVRDRGGRAGAACVQPSTAERLGWEPFDRDEWRRAHAPPQAPPAYDLPIVRAAQSSWGGDMRFSLSASRLPAVGETAEVTATYGGGAEGGPGRGSSYEAAIRLSPNLEFVGIEGAEAWRSYYPDGQGSKYTFEIPPGPAGAPHSFSATIRAVSGGYAEVSYGGEYHSARIEMYAGPHAGLLVDDYHRMSAPLPDMSAFRDAGWAGKWGAGGPPAAARLAR